MADWFDREGNEIDMMEWSRLHSDRDYIIVAKDSVKDPNSPTESEVSISTVWLGLDHNFSDEGPPIIFETMIFGGEHDEYCWRYATEEDAKDGHERIKTALEENRDPSDYMKEYE